MSLRVFANKDELAVRSAEHIVTIAKQSIESRKTFSIALSGGSTPRATYEQLAKADLNWQQIHVFWVDERCVPPTDSESNYRMAKEALLSHVAIPQEHIHRMKGELEPSQGAAQYREELAAHFGAGGLPHFDLVLLGLGEDGHTASLFPGTDALKRGDEMVVENYVPLLEGWRLTLTFPAINAAKNVMFLVSGAHKAQVVKDVLQGRGSRLPASAIRPATGKLDWFLDKEAAGLLSSQALGN